ncbi:Plasma membrane-associated cation-binding protein 1 [Capsicum annuum]|uniref:plasma membrane-associated cation-binding protein 1 n=1 Tax=Capsicum annuum TaxID=4072 RepID=UPI0007BFE970|nr:plasma membrane-associated cation-binding protein 1 [Capsicum annuum]KAF3634061.1 Plasma membrane-associated cation-binding protein 1 [Capsicum annuum]KAF3682129.1 Plasma membrane-associated cation-binding protein 1 [Capsicum annuum]
MGYWKAKVLPKIKMIFEKNGPKKAAAAEASKTFDETKEQYNKEFEEKKAELQPKVVEIYEAAAVEIKTLVKEPKDAGLKKHSAGVQKFLDELVKIEFPGSKAVSEASSNFGPSYVSGPIRFVFEKVSTFIVIPEEEKKKEEEPAPVDVAPADVEATTATSAEEVEVKEKDIVVEAAESKKEEESAPADVAPVKVEEVPAPADVAPVKVEAAPAAAAAAAPAPSKA